MKCWAALKAVFFDLDGTLVNSRLMSQKVLYNLFQRYQGRLPSKEEFHGFTGKPTREILAMINDENPEKILQETIELEMKFQHLETIYRGVPEMIQDLSGMHIPMAVITSRARAELENSRPTYCFSQYIHTWISADDVSRPKPDPESLFKTYSLMGIDPEEILFIGDTAFDVKAGQNAGVKTGFVLWDSTISKTMSLQADLTFETPGQVVDWVREQIHKND